MSSSGALKSPAPIVAELRKRLSQLDNALEPVVARNVSALTDELEAGRAVASSSSTSASTSAAGSSDKQGAQRAGKLQSAQLQASLAYVLLDLVWILLKVEGKDVARHPVMAELKRVHAYLQKVQKPDAESAEDKAPAVDKGKAQRFIQGALGKRTIFAEDGSVQRVVDAGTAKKKGASSSDDDSSDSSESSSDEPETSSSRKPTAGPNDTEEQRSSVQSKDKAEKANADATMDGGDDGTWEKPVSKKERREAQKLKAEQRKASNVVAASSDAQRVRKATLSKEKSSKGTSQSKKKR